jgi:precorrin-2 dehydrogenase / sirohydrochlorin ferrochelatase
MQERGSDRAPGKKDFAFSLGALPSQRKITSLSAHAGAFQTMIPIALDPSRLRLGVAGEGPAAARRRARLEAGGAHVVTVDPDAPLLGQIDVLWVADLPEEVSAELARAARQAGVLVNVEDRPQLCDFHSVAELRRGTLLIGVSTGGESPGLARRIRDRIEALLGPEWGARVGVLGSLRRGWRAEGRPVEELARLTDQHIDRSGWLA